MAGRGKGHKYFQHTNHSVGYHDTDNDSSSSEYELDEASITRRKDDK